MFGVQKLSAEFAELLANWSSSIIPTHYQYQWTAEWGLGALYILRSLSMPYLPYYSGYFAILSLGATYLKFLTKSFFYTKSSKLRNPSVLTSNKCWWEVFQQDCFPLLRLYTPSFTDPHTVTWIHRRRSNNGALWFMTFIKSFLYLSINFTARQWNSNHSAPPW